MLNFAASVLLCVILFPQSSPAADELVTHRWPSFRGEHSTGVGHGKGLPDRWDATTNVAWCRDIPGRGWSSPVIWDGRVIVTTVERDGAYEEPKKGLYFGGDRKVPSDAIHRWQVLCFDLENGKTLWEHTVHTGKPPGPIHIKNSYASETPVTDGKRVYAYFGNVGIFCFDMNGKTLWERRFKPHPTRYGWGTAASPVVHHDRVYIVNDNEEDSWLRCLDAGSGKDIWRVKRNETSNWATPFVWQNDQRTEIVTPGTNRTRGYDLDGRVLYEFGGLSSITIATPYADSGLLYVSSGYVMDQRRPIFAVRPGASGDISLAKDQTSGPFVAWCQKRAAPYNPTTLVYKGLLYVLYDRGIVACYDSKTGEEVYGRQRLPNGGNFTSSPWACNDKVFCINEDGRTFVLQAGRSFKLLHTNDLREDDMAMASPAMADQRLVIRTRHRLYCLQTPTEDTASAQ